VTIAPATLAVVVGCALVTTGCAFGHHHAYHTASPSVARGSFSVALAVQDAREGVVSGGNPTFVGLSRGGFGNAFDVTTASGQPLADDFAVSIRRGLEAAGYRVTPVRVMSRARQETVVGALARTGAQRLMFVEIQVWRSDTMMRTRLDYDLTLRVFDSRGQELARANTADSLVLGSESHVEPMYARKLERLLNDDAVKGALVSSSAPADAPAVTPAEAPAPDPAS
jgi:hypothetical protein